jgi:predicted transcriptional regulator
MTTHKAQVAQEMYHSGQYTVATIAKTLGVSRASIYRHLVSPVTRACLARWHLVASAGPETL